MYVLALDTTTRRGSLALLQGDRLLDLMALPVEEPVGTRLPIDIKLLLERYDLPLGSVDAFSVVTGPGSFTGIRIGVATMQGLALASHRPLVGVSALDALARLACPAGDVAVSVWVDAWRGEVYGGFYGQGIAMREPIVDRPESLLAEVTSTARGEPVVFIGDGAARYRAVIIGSASVFTLAEPAAPLLAEAAARLALREIGHDRSRGPGTIQPLYVRRPDVELARAAGRGREFSR